jgi:hypothetical protein
LRKGHYIIVFTGNYQERDSYLVRMQGGGIFFEHFLIFIRVTYTVENVLLNNAVLFNSKPVLVKLDLLF